jgi:hypothetical protein
VADLIEAVERLDLSTIEATYGCPDCADGGAVLVTLTDAAGETATIYEYIAPPAEFTTLDRVGKTCWSRSLPARRATSSPSPTPANPSSSDPDLAHGKLRSASFRGLHQHRSGPERL